jgi:hypothetical protein
LVLFIQIGQGETITAAFWRRADFRHLHNAVPAPGLIDLDVAPYTVTNSLPTILLPET